MLALFGLMLRLGWGPEEEEKLLLFTLLLLVKIDFERGEKAELDEGAVGEVAELEPTMEERLIIVFVVAAILDLCL